MRWKEFSLRVRRRRRCVIFDILFPISTAAPHTEFIFFVMPLFSDEKRSLATPSSAHNTIK